MKTLIIFAHPKLDSFNGAILEAVIDELKVLQSEIRVRDLYRIGFQPVLDEDNYSEFYQTKIPADIVEEQSYLLWADQIILIFPTWWSGMPAILKGYIDRVFSNGFAFRMIKNGTEGLLKGKKGLIFQTTGQPEQKLKPSQLTMAMETAMDYGIFHACGIDTVSHQFLYGVTYSDQATRQRMLREIRDIIQIL
ncbi:NAD(P)H-dependent oxidoreductase [Metabacillus sp. KIGAM252]|uniref:NAD(P)H-dependent oxidoreductase n=1 Tax=Metabacillus flavus TaxID=2823519 RepID=A0ABS5LC89_9BACI|nr:NAD(P)H-dependent oxidoreductase [Metabacillus flavus]MBS2968044.1 NAD(P)H-dependent oxidoreductase [Metabacillus flavus]